MAEGTLYTMVAAFKEGRMCVQDHAGQQLHFELKPPEARGHGATELDSYDSVQTWGKVRLMHSSMLQ